MRDYVMSNFARPKTEALVQRSSKASLGGLRVRRAFVVILAATVAMTTYAVSAVTGSTSSASQLPIFAVGSPTLYSGYVGASAFRTVVRAANVGDLFVLAAINDTWADEVTTVSGGDVTSWHRAEAPFLDGQDGQIMQIWYGQVRALHPPPACPLPGMGGSTTRTSPSRSSVRAPTRTWSLVGNGTSFSPFPALSSPESGTLYFGAAMGWGNAVAGATPGVTYTVPNTRFLLAWNTDASGDVVPAATGAGSVAALFNATAPASAPTLAPTTTTTAVSPTSTTVVPTAPSTSASPANVPPALLWTDSLFDDDVQNWPVDLNSAEFAEDVVADYNVDYGAVGVNAMPIYSVAANQGVATISVSLGCNNFTVDTGTEVPIPSYASMTGSSDSPIVIYQPSTGTEWEFWQLTRRFRQQLQRLLGRQTESGDV